MSDTSPQKRGPWQLVSSAIKYKNPWITVREDQVLRPDGKPGIFGVVSMLPGVSVLPVDEEDNVYLVKEYKYGTEKETIEVISGGIESGDNILQTVAKELREETGLEATEIIELGSIDPFTTVVNSPNHLFLACGLKQGTAEPEGTELLEVLKVPFAQALQWVEDSAITHGASVAVILKAAKYIN